MNKVIYELPLHEQTRVLIRLESLFRLFYSNIGSSNSSAIYFSLKGLDDILTIMDRNDIEKYLHAEFAELSEGLKKWRLQKGVDTSVIDKITKEFNQLSNSLPASMNRSALVAEIDFVKNFRQRAITAGGTSIVDFPRFHYWLQKDSETPKKMFHEWGKSFDSCYKSVSIVLRLIRQSAQPTPQIAKEGFFQQTLDKNVELKLIRAELPAGSSCFAELTGGRYHVTVRMMEDDWEYGLKLHKKDINFILSKCQI